MRNLKFGFLWKLGGILERVHVSAGFPNWTTLTYINGLGKKDIGLSAKAALNLTK
jgi:hypothetical protein